MVGALLLAASLVVPPQQAPIGKLNQGPKVVFRLQGKGNTNNEFVLEPMLPVNIFGLVSSDVNDPPKAGDIFSCKAGSKTLGKIIGDDGKPVNATSSILILDCGKYTFFIEGIQFTPE